MATSKKSTRLSPTLAAGEATCTRALIDTYHARLDAAGYSELTENGLAALDLALADAAQADKMRSALVDAGYCERTVDNREALDQALADADEARRAREVLVANAHRFDDDDVAEALYQATVVIEEHVQALDVLDRHGVFDGGYLLDMLDDVAGDAADARLARELLLEDGRMRDAEDLPGAVQWLIAELAELHTLLVDSGYLSCEVSRGSTWNSDPAGALRQVIKAAGEARSA